MPIELSVVEVAGSIFCLVGSAFLFGGIRDSAMERVWIGLSFIALAMVVVLTYG